MPFTCSICGTVFEHIPAHRVTKPKKLCDKCLRKRALAYNKRKREERKAK